MGARISEELREEISKDLIMSHFLMRFFAYRSWTALADEFGVCHITIRNIYYGRIKYTNLTPDQVKSIMVARKQADLLMPLRWRYTKNGIAKARGVAHHTVSRVQRDYFDRRNKWRTPQ